jgi:hypothetical protein
MSMAKRICNIERTLFALAGAVTLSSVLLAVVVSPWFLIATVFVGGNQLVYAAAGDCPASLLLRRACRSGVAR